MDPPKKKREYCTTCERPQNVCLCACIPKEKIKLKGKVVIFQHPHEGKRALGTVKLLQKCIDCQVLVRR